MIEYPKIDTLFNRDPKTFKVIPGEIRRPEFRLVNRWHITEKVDGTNIRIGVTTDTRLVIGGRTDSAQIPTFLLSYLQETFSLRKILDTFPGAQDEIQLFGEGYGEKIQKGGGNYRKGVSFRLFDVLIGNWWLEWENVVDIASKLGIETVPHVADIWTTPESLDELSEIIGEESYVSVQDGGAGLRPEGIVARTTPLLFNRRGERVMWKLKYKDF